MDVVIKVEIGTGKLFNQIETAIKLILQQNLQKPDLTAIAAQIQMSDYQFRQMFIQWIGITPEQFLLYLTVEYTRAKILQTKTSLYPKVDRESLNLKVSNDSAIILKSMLMEEAKSGGVGLQIRYGIHQTLFGLCVIGTTLQGICTLRFLDSRNPEEEAAKLFQTEWQQANVVFDPEQTYDLCDRIFHPASFSQPPIELYVKGTNFQLQVWQTLLAVPFAGITTYQGVATAIGRPSAARAIGNAVGSNPIAYLIPCHRVLRESGEMGGYRWGLHRKAALLGWEASRHLSLEQK